MAEEDESDDAGGPEMTSEDASEGQRASAQTVALSEKDSIKAIKAVKKKMKKPKDAPRIPGDSDRHPRGAPSPTFKAMFDDYIHGMTPETLQEKYKLTEKTMRQKIPELELAKRRVIEGLRGRGELPQAPAQPAPPSQTVEQTLPASSGGSGALQQPPATPPTTPNPAVVPQNPPSTYTVPAVPAGNALAVTGAPPTSPASKTPSESVEDDAGERETIPRWLRHDGGELVNTIEMAIDPNLGVEGHS